ncbi:MAG: hypothetical protein EOP04_33220 [Proteobacteria bacterium]|nr:MAG: hypothetical protein EOP04_33220 [Pseudomonadota bacterium]
MAFDFDELLISHLLDPNIKHTNREYRDSTSRCYYTVFHAAFDCMTLQHSYQRPAQGSVHTHLGNSLSTVFGQVMPRISDKFSEIRDYRNFADYDYDFGPLRKLFGERYRGLTAPTSEREVWERTIDISKQILRAINHKYVP